MTHPLKGTKQTAEHVARRIASYPKERKLRSLESILFSKIEFDENNCWNWTGAIFKKPYGNYGQMRVGRRGEQRLRRAHVVSYEHFIGTIPNGLEIDHNCQNTLCINPDHLEAVTHSENMARGRHATKMHCKHGHEYTPDNLFINSKGRRECRICRRVSRLKSAQKVDTN